MNNRELDLVIVGAGFAGMYMLHRSREMGLSAHVFETGGDAGGTWYWNRYPGARCDVESMEYSYQFSEELQQEWEWSERYATQPEILRYVNHVAERFDLRRDITFNTRVESATFDEKQGRWLVETSKGDRVSATYCVMATGCLSSTNTPNFQGMDSYQGPIYHTGEWPHEGVDFTGKRVGIIGTGSSAIQSIPVIAKQAEHLYVFQRTPNYSVPAHTGPLDPELVREVKANYPALRAKAKLGWTAQLRTVRMESALDVSQEEREEEFKSRWEYGGLSFMASFNDLLIRREANDTAAEFVRGKIKETVKDPKVAEILSPHSLVGTKRPCIDSGYFETYNRPNVTLLDISESPIEKFAPSGVVALGETFEVDAIVLATGFDAMTGALNKIDIRGLAGRKLKEKWEEGPRTFLGLATAGFPNLFLITGPGSPSVLTNMLPSIEQHVNWISDLMEYMRREGLTRIEPTLKAEDQWVDHVNEVANMTLFPQANSWYMGANIPGKPRVFMPYYGFPPYVEKCNEVAGNGYEGFSLS